MNPMTTPEGMFSALEAIHDEVLKLIEFVDTLNLPNDSHMQLTSKLSTIESLANHQVDIRSPQERSES